MKRMRIMAAAVVAAVLAACGGGAEVKQYSGMIADATPNGVTVEAFGKTVLFPTEGADMKEARGLLPGSPVTVTYTGDLADPAAIEVVKVVADATYACAVGRWVMSDPTAPERMQGIEILAGGAARSFGMATQRYTAWELTLDDDHILLLGERGDPDAPVEFELEGLLAETAEGPTLTVNGLTLRKE